MKLPLALACALLLNGCSLLAKEENPTAGVGIVNHTGHFIYSATVTAAVSMRTS